MARVTSSRRRPPAAPLLVLAALLSQLALASPVAAQAPAPATPTARPFQVLLLDALAPFFDPSLPAPRSWAMPFSHMDALEAPYVREAHLASATARFEAYCDEAKRLGYTAVWVGNLIHLALFDDLPEGRGAVYCEASPYRARHERYRALYRRLAQAAHARGLALALDTDFPAYTPDLVRYVLEGGKAPDDPAAPTNAYAHRSPPPLHPRMLAALQAAILEALRLGVDMIQVRIGEGGGAYNERTGYASAVAATSVEAAQEVIRACLEPIEAQNLLDGGRRRLLARTWTIGIGPLGRLHTSPDLYRRVFAPFEGRPALIAVMKHVAMDFYEFVPRNSTIGIPGVSQIVEFQARREYELFGAFPSWRGRSFAADLERLRPCPEVVGISVWPTNGGFLWSAPVYWGCTPHAEWIDANVYAYARMARDPSLRPEDVANAWARERGGVRTDSEAAVVAGILARSEALTAKGLYVGAFATNPAPLPALDHPPTMLWMWWTRPIGAWGAQALIWSRARRDPDASIREGEEALAEAQNLGLLAEALPPSPLRERLVESLEYERSVLEVLACYRASFLNHLAWAEGGAAVRYDAWVEADRRLAEALTRHETTWRAAPHLPPLDGSDLRRVLRDDDAIRALRFPAGALAAMCLAAAILLSAEARRAYSHTAFVAGELSERKRALSGIAIFLNALEAVERLRHAAAAPGARAALARAVGASALLGLATALFLCGHEATSVLRTVALAALASWAAASLGLALGRRYGEAERAAPLASLLAPALPLFTPALALAALLCAVFAWRGPALVWIWVVGTVHEGWSQLVVGGLALAFAWWTARDAWGGTAPLGAESASPRPRRAAGTLAALLLALLAAKAVLAPDLPRAVLALNEATRLGPSILGQAGTGVEDFMPGR